MSVLTRIKNNQILDSTIYANAKIVPGSIVGSLFNSNLTMTSDVTITGNLTVQGASTYLTVASTNTYVNDPLIVLNNAFSGTNTYDLGFVFNRGTLQNTALIWNEFNKEFRLVGTTETGTTYGNINQSNFANLQVGNLTTQYTATIQGNIDQTLTGIYGATFAGNVGLNGPYVTTNQGQISLFPTTATTINVGSASSIIKTPGSINAAGNVSAVELIARNLTTRNDYGNINLTQYNSIFADGNGSQNIVAIQLSTTGLSDGMGMLGTTGLSGQIYSTRGIVFNTGVTVRNEDTPQGGVIKVAITPAGDLWANATTPASNTTTGAFVVKGGVGIGGNLYAGAGIQDTAIGNVTAAAGSFTVLNAANSVWANASIATTAQGTGAVIIPNGGISVSGAANIGSTVTVAGATQLNSTLGVGGITTFTNSTNATSITDGAVIIQGGASVLKDLYVGGNLYAANIVGVTANVITVEDPLLFLKPSYTFPYNYDIGIYSSFQGAGLTTAGNVLQHTGVVRHQETNTWTFASNLAEPGGGHVVFDNNTVYDPIKAGNLELTVTTDATSATSGALIVAGGAGIGGNIFHSGTRLDTSASNYLFASTPTTVDAFKAATDLEIGATSGTFTVNNPTVVGTQTTQALYNTTATTVNAFGAATGILLGATSGTLLVNNPTIVGSQTTQNVFNANATTVNAFGAATSLVLGATTGVSYLRTANITLPNVTDVVVGQTSLNFANTVATTVNAFGAATSLHLGSATGTTTIRNRLLVDREVYNGSTTNGALRVVGTGAFGSNLFVGNGAVINDLQSSERFRVKGVTSTNVFVVDPGYQAVFVNGPGNESNITLDLGATFSVRSSDSLLLPVGSTADRPSNTGNVDLRGMLRYSTSLGTIEWYNGAEWAVPGAASTVITDQQINGDGVSNVFILSNTSTTNSTIVSINGVLQFPVTAYGISGNVLTFTEAPAVGDVIDVRVLTTTTTVSSLESANGFVVFDVSNNTNTYANIVAGLASPTVRVAVDIEGKVNLVNDTKIAVDGTAYNIAANNTPYTIDTYTQSRYTMAKYEVKAKRGTGAGANIEAYSATVITDGAGNAYITTYGIINNGYAMGVLSANVLGGNVQLYYTSVSAAGVMANVKIYASYIV